MAYIGQNADGNFTTSVSKDTFSGNDSTTAFTLSEAATTNTVDVFVENIRQEPTTAYTVDGTTLTFTAAPVTGTDNIYVVNRGPIQLSASHPAAQALTAFSATITNDLTVDTNTLFVDASADAVGVGTTSPDGLAHVYNGMLQVGSKTGDTSIQQNANAIRIAAVPNSSTEWGGLQWYREFSDVIGAEIIASRPSSPETDTDLIFKTSTNSSNAVEVARITHGGNVGIGTTSPARTLQVHTAGANSSYISVTNGNTGSTSSDGIVIGSASDSTAYFWNYENAAMAFATNSTERMRIDSSGNVGIGTTDTASARLRVEGGSNSATSPVLDVLDADTSVEGASTLIRTKFSADTSYSNAYYLLMQDSGGTQGIIYGTGNGTVTYATSSDERRKQNISDTTSKWTTVKSLRVRDYEWISTGNSETGFIAQELNTYSPSAVKVGGDDVETDPWLVDYGRLTPILTKALQEAMERIETLEAKVTALENA